MAIKPIMLLVTLLVLIMQPNSAFASSRPNPLVFTHTTVIDATGTPAQPDMTVIIRGNRLDTIAKSENASIPKNAQVVNAEGQFLIPGLWDMHVHHPSDEMTRKLFFPLYIANGVTGIRDMFGDRYSPTSPEAVGLETVNQWRREIAAGTLLAPRIIASSAILDGGKPVWTGSMPVTNAAEGRRAVQWSLARRADFVKVYSLLPRDAYFAIADEAKKQHIPFAGHVPLSVTAAEASDAGQRSIEHLTGILLACSTHEKQLQQSFQSQNDGSAFLAAMSWLQPKRLVETFSSTKAEALLRKLVRNHTWQVPTLTVLRASALLDDESLTNDPRLKYIPPQAREQWQQRSQTVAKSTTSAKLAERKAAFQKQLEIVGAMNQAGVQILAGTDTLNPYILPGFSLHDELELLVQAGLTPMAALQTATLKPAQYLGLSDSFGTVEPGKIADLVLLDANPLEQIGNTRKIAAIVVNGRFVDKANLQQLLNQAEGTAHTQSQRWNGGGLVASLGSMLAALAIVRFFRFRELPTR